MKKIKNIPLAILGLVLMLSFTANNIQATSSNYITVDQGVKEENFTLMNEVLEYTIYFQNIYNSEAGKLLIQDEFSEYLNISSFEIVEMSHELTEYEGFFENNAIQLSFHNINLPSINSSEEDSKGYFKFRIYFHQNINIPENTLIENNVRIIFDQDPAIITNTVFNTMVSVLPIPIISASQASLNFGEQEVDKPISQIVQILNLGGEELIISDISFTNAAFYLVEEINTEIEAQNVEFLQLWFNPTEVIDYEGAMIIESNAGRIEIFLSGKGDFRTGIMDVSSNNKVHVYPNPVRAFATFSIENPTAEKQILSINNALGQQINRVENIASSKFSLDCSDYNTGIYYFQLRNRKGLLVEQGKFIVQ